MRTYQIICIDDDEQFLSSMENMLPDKVISLCNFDCVFDFVSTPEELDRMMEIRTQSGIYPAMVISDQVMPHTNGIALIEKLKVAHPDLVCILLTGHAGLESAKYAINKRLLDQYVSKPIEDMQGLASMVVNLLQRYHLNLEEKERTAELARTVEELRKSNEKIHQMQTAAEQVAMLSKKLKSLDFDEVIDLTAGDVPQLFGARRSLLCLPSDESYSCSLRNNCSCPVEEANSRDDIKITTESGVVYVGDINNTCPKFGGRPPEIIIPLTIHRNPLQSQGSQAEQIGYLCMCDVEKKDELPDDLPIYVGKLLQDILSANLSNAKLYQEARQQSRTDVLTGLSTRRVLDETIESECERSERYSRPFSAAMIDVDNFKQINDTLGHAEGDMVLKKLAEVLRKETRATDTIARYGGDEFVLLMPETELEETLQAMERIRRAVESSNISDNLKVTISCGVASWNQTSRTTPMDLIRRADVALYQAKQAGRNCIAATQPSASKAEKNHGKHILTINED